MTENIKNAKQKTETQMDVHNLRDIKLHETNFVQEIDNVSEKTKFDINNDVAKGEFAISNMATGQKQYFKFNDELMKEASDMSSAKIVAYTTGAATAASLLAAGVIFGSKVGQAIPNPLVKGVSTVVDKVATMAQAGLGTARVGAGAVAVGEVAGAGTAGIATTTGAGVVAAGEVGAAGIATTTGAARVIATLGEASTALTSSTMTNVANITTKASKLIGGVIGGSVGGLSGIVAGTNVSTWTNNIIDSKLKDIYSAEKIREVKAKGVNTIDVQDLVNDPYSDSLSIFQGIEGNSSSNSGKMVNLLVGQVAELEAGKVSFTKTIVELVKEYDKYKDVPGKEDLALEAGKSIDNAIVNYQKFKESRINTIDSTIKSGVQENKFPGDLQKVLMDSQTFNQLRSLSYLDKTLVTLDKGSKIDELNKMFNGNDLSKIEGAAFAVRMGHSDNVLGKSKIKDSNGFDVELRMKNASDNIIGMIDTIDKNNPGDMAKLMKEYKDLTSATNDFKQIVSKEINPLYSSYIPEKGKDFIDTSASSNYSKVMNSAADNFAKIEQEKKYLVEIEKPEDNRNVGVMNGL